MIGQLYNYLTLHGMSVGNSPDRRFKSTAVARCTRVAAQRTQNSQTRARTELRADRRWGLRAWR